MAANEALIAARVAQPSRSRPRHPLSRNELADLVNRYVWDHYRQQTPVDENYIGKFERGVVRWPGAVYREAILAIWVLRMSVTWAFDPLLLNRLTARNRRERVRRCRSSVRPRACWTSWRLRPGPPGSGRPRSIRSDRVDDAFRRSAFGYRVIGLAGQ
jgi:hypothetical protein